MRKLRNTVIVNGVAYERGSTPPREVAEKISNEAAWEGSEETSPQASEPPRAGPGSGVEAWRAYATSRGIEVPDDAGRDDIIALVS